MVTTTGSTVRAAGVACLAAWGTSRGLGPRLRTAPRTGWVSTNHAGAVVDLAGGPAALAGVLAGLAAGGGASRPRATAILVPVAAALAGRYDDVAGARPAQAGDKGVRGHARALRSGRPVRRGR